VSSRHDVGRVFEHSPAELRAGFVARRGRGDFGYPGPYVSRNEAAGFVNTEKLGMSGQDLAPLGKVAVERNCCSHPAIEFIRVAVDDSCLGLRHRLRTPSELTHE